MAECVYRYRQTSWYNSQTDYSNTGCTHQLLTTEEYNNLTEQPSTNLEGLIQLLDEYFKFDLEVFSIMTVITLVLFVTGYSLGRTSRLLSRT